MGQEWDLPEELYGFGGLLLWVLATRATSVVDECFDAGPARGNPERDKVGGHWIPTASVVAWLLIAAEFDVPMKELARADARTSRRQHVLRSSVSRVLKGESASFPNRWLDNLANACNLGPPERELLATSRDETGHAVDPEALRRAIAKTLRSAAAPTVRSTPSATRTLPRDVSSFTGRTMELRALMTAPEQVLVIHAIGGMAGVGKTALAVHAAHRLAAQFPDGQIFLQLHGHTPGQQPVTPKDALARLLQMSGVDAQRMPPTVEERAALWRDHLADRRLLLLLDDAAGHEQVRPLLPGGPPSMVIITSRLRLTALEEVRSISLDTLTSDEAGRLFVLLAGRPELQPDDADVGRIVQLCGNLPLALGMQARRLHHHPVWSASDLAAELAAAKDRLMLMSAENVSVAAAFDASYDDLADHERLLLRRLGLQLGDDIDAYAAAALAGANLDATRRNLEALYDHYLVGEPAAGRYRLHDLLRAHARMLAEGDPPAVRADAVGRLLDYYEHTVAKAATLTSRYPRPRPAESAQFEPAPQLGDRTHALFWARTERSNLLACLDHASLTGQHQRAVVLTEAIAPLLRQDGPWADALSRHTAAGHAAQQIDDRVGEADALWEAGVLHRLESDYDDATLALEDALGRYGELGIHRGEANAWHELGVVGRLRGRYEDAVEAQQKALDLYNSVGDRLGVANARRELGAIAYQRADYDVVLEEQRVAIETYRDIGDGAGEADALVYLGAVRGLTGDLTGAAHDLNVALAIFRDEHDRRGQANALTQLAAVQRAAGDFVAAADGLQRAIGLCRDLGFRSGEANALVYLGAMQGLSGEHEDALVTFAAALTIFQEIGDPGGATETWAAIGEVHLHCRRLDRADAAYRRALALADEVDSSWDEGQACVGLGRTAVAHGRTAAARAYLARAARAFDGVDPEKLAEVSAELAALPPEPRPGAVRIVPVVA